MISICCSLFCYVFVMNDPFNILPSNEKHTTQEVPGSGFPILDSTLLLLLTGLFSSCLISRKTELEVSSHIVNQK